MGATILDKAWEGLNCTAFAYGQTGAGKSYTFFGYGANKGIIPMACTKIFEKISAIDDPNITTELTVQMVEIYCEKIQDLLNPKKGQNLEVRQVADQIYVEGARKEVCNSYAAIQKQIDKGDSNRSVSGTAMNKTSSRSHTVVTIEFTKKTKIGDKTAKTHSIINLVDLAGSEK